MMRMFCLKARLLWRKRYVYPTSGLLPCPRASTALSSVLRSTFNSASCAVQQRSMGCHVWTNQQMAKANVELGQHWYGTSRPLKDHLDLQLLMLIVAAAPQSGVRHYISRAGLPNDTEIPPECYVLDKVPHDRLFPKVDAALHHGGAGIPTIITPWFSDQFFWAPRVQKLGCQLSKLRTWPMASPRRLPTRLHLSTPTFHRLPVICNSGPRIYIGKLHLSLATSYHDQW